MLRKLWLCREFSETLAQAGTVLGAGFLTRARLNAGVWLRVLDRGTTNGSSGLWPKLGNRSLDLEAGGLPVGSAGLFLRKKVANTLMLIKCLLFRLSPLFLAQRCHIALEGSGSWCFHDKQEQER